MSQLGDDGQRWVNVTYGGQGHEGYGRHVVMVARCGKEGEPAQEYQCTFLEMCNSMILKMQIAESV
ncbi:MAG: hypothetical protein JOY96_02040 [Verrucomicrobia bacterium]|nr:hypothetical protein [Verrucomicrobiota bacterium]